MKVRGSILTHDVFGLSERKGVNEMMNSVKGDEKKGYLIIVYACVHV